MPGIFRGSKPVLLVSALMACSESSSDPPVGPDTAAVHRGQVYPLADAGQAVTPPVCVSDPLPKRTGDWKTDSALCFALYFTYTSFRCEYHESKDETRCESKDTKIVSYTVQWIDGEIFNIANDAYVGRIDPVPEERDVYNLELELEGKVTPSRCTVKDSHLELCSR